MAVKLINLFAPTYIIKHITNQTETISHQSEWAKERSTKCAITKLQ